MHQISIVDMSVSESGRVHYEMSVPLADIGFTEKTLEDGFIFQAKVFDDDGIADDVDFWMETKRCWMSVEGIGKEKGK